MHPPTAPKVHISDKDLVTKAVTYLNGLLQIAAETPRENIREFVTWIQGNLLSDQEIGIPVIVEFVSTLVRNKDHENLEIVLNLLDIAWLRRLPPDKANELCDSLIVYCAQDHCNIETKELVILALLKMVPGSFDSIEKSVYMGWDEKFALVKRMFEENDCEENF